MKKFTMPIMVALFAFISVSCSHNQNFAAHGKVLRIGPLFLYVNGLVIASDARENSEVVVKINDDDDVKETGGNLGSVKAIGFHIGPQNTGYLADLAKVNPEAVCKYMDYVVELQRPVWSIDQTVPNKPKKDKKVEPKVEPETPVADEPGDIVRDTLSVEDTFVCNGKSCSYADLSGHTSVVYLKSAIEVLSKYDGSKTMVETGESYADTLKDFSKMMEVYEKYNYSNSKVALLRVKVVDNVIVDLMYCARDMEGGVYEVQCPNCAPWEPEEHIGE